MLFANGHMSNSIYVSPIEDHKCAVLDVQLVNECLNFYEKWNKKKDDHQITATEPM